MKRKFGKEQVVGYWTTSTNIVLVLTTFWLGLVVQDFVAERNANVSAVLTNVEYVKCVKPQVDSLNIQYNSFLHDIYVTLNEGNAKLITAGSINTITSRYNETSQYIISRYNEISHYCDDLIETSKKVMYYFDDVNATTKTAKISSTLANLINNSNEALTNLINNSNMETKIGALYYLTELLDFYYESDTVNPNKHKTLNDWPILEQRLIKLNQHPDLISITGLNIISSDELKDLCHSLYKSFFQKDGTPSDDKLLSVIYSTLFIALDIHYILNNNRFYVQKENKIITRILKAPWSILIIGILAIWIVFTKIVFKTAGNKNQSEDEINGKIKELENKLGSINGRFVEINNEKKTINEIMYDIKNQLDKVKNQLDEVLKSASNPPKES